MADSLIPETRPQQAEQADAADPEIAAIKVVHCVLRNLEPEAQQRVIDYVIRKLSLVARGVDISGKSSNRMSHPTESHAPNPSPSVDTSAITDDLEGISPVAVKWMRRSNLKSEELSKLFSIGADEIDLVTSTIPGKSKKERMHSVALLKGMAAYISNGAARMTYEELKEACLHYDAYDSSNFAAYLKNFASEIGGTKETGLALNARGLTVATDLIKSMLKTEKQ